MSQVIFPETHLLPRLFTPSLAQKYEELYEENGVKFLKVVFLHRQYTLVSTHVHERVDTLSHNPCSRNFFSFIGCVYKKLGSWSWWKRCWCSTWKWIYYWSRFGKLIAIFLHTKFLAKAYTSRFNFFRLLLVLEQNQLSVHSIRLLI